jgi:predicted amidohydrolase YtcJ
MIDRDLTAIKPETIRDAQVVRTIVDGKIVYEAKP